MERDMEFVLPETVLQRRRARRRAERRTQRSSKVSREVIRHNRLIYQVRIEEIDAALRLLEDRRTSWLKDLRRLQLEQCKHPNRARVPESKGVFECPDCAYSNRAVEI